MTSDPEAIARRHIDAQLAASGWVLQDARDFNRNAAEGVAVREIPLSRANPTFEKPTQR